MLHRHNTYSALERSPPVGQDDWAALCHAVCQCIDNDEWREMHATLRGEATCTGIKKVGQRVAGSQQLAHHKRDRQDYIYDEEDLEKVLKILNEAGEQLLMVRATDRASPPDRREGQCRTFRGIRLWILGDEVAMDPNLSV